MGVRIFLKEADHSFLDLIIPIGATIIWGTLFFFVDQLNSLRITLESDSFSEKNARKKRYKITFRVMIFLLVLIYFPLNIAVFLGYVNKLGNIQLFSILNYARGISKVIIDSYFFFILIVSFVFFIEKKIQALKDKDKSLSKMQVFILSWTFFNILLKIMHAVINSVIATILAEKE